MATRDAYACVGSLGVLSLLIATPSIVLAQIAGAEITGAVVDQAGAPVPGATVTVRNVATDQTRLTVSTAQGIYTIAGLPPGKYRVEIVLPGFKTVRRDGIRVVTGEKARLDFELTVGDVREEVTVTADAPALRAETASLGTVVEHEQIVQLPLNGRTFIALASLAPGVALPPNSQLPRINGGRPRTNEYLFDGISVLQPEPGQMAYVPLVDAIQEFKIESNSPPAEFGRFNGGVINLTTKAGTNVFHGDGFEFVRNSGDTSGVAGLFDDFDEFAVYESHINRLATEYPQAVLCLYDLALVGGGMMLDLLRTHPKLLLGGLLIENPHYLTPDEYLTLKQHSDRTR